MFEKLRLESCADELKLALGVVAEKWPASKGWPEERKLKAALMLIEIDNLNGLHHQRLEAINEEMRLRYQQTKDEFRNRMVNHDIESEARMKREAECK